MKEDFEQQQRRFLSAIEHFVKLTNDEWSLLTLTPTNF